MFQKILGLTAKVSKIAVLLSIVVDTFQFFQKQLIERGIGEAENIK